MNRALWATALVLVTLAMGCASKQMLRPRWNAETIPGSTPLVLAGHRLYVDGRRQPLSEADLRAALDWADVVLVGESHDSPTDHEFQRALLTFACRHLDRLALSMEHLERDEQPIVDQYLLGDIDAATFAEKTNSARWAGEGSWEKWFQPIVDVAADNGIRLVAANAPKRYSSLAYKEGFEALRALPADDQAYFVLPLTVDDRAYRRRFRRAAGDHNGITRAMVDQMYAGQQVWDATMADSVLSASAVDGKVIHLAGRFHVERDGGIVQQLIARQPDLAILTIAPGHDAHADIVAKPRR